MIEIKGVASTMNTITGETEKRTHLTEPELVRMPANDYMNDDQLEFFRARLNELRAGLQENLGRGAETLEREIAEADPSDRATIEEERALDLQTRDRARQLALKIERALSRIEQRVYGYCEETGEPIGIPRLLARPTAEVTVEAQERRERSRKVVAG
jgi:DnaK suppressor protein